MNTDSIISEMRSLAEQLEYHSKRYYEDDSPEIDDSEYDRMFARLKELEAAYPQLALANSPTSRVGGRVAERFEKVRHAVPLGSLTDVFSFEELRAFDTKIKSTFPDAEYVVEAKIDGLSVALEYVDGQFKQGLTRGDGQFGEDVTDNIRTIRSIPLKIDTDAERIIVRGEVYMPKRIFEKLNIQREENGESVFANPRNAAAGSLRQLNSALCAKRRLDIFVFNLQTTTGSFSDSHRECLDMIENLGFHVSPWKRVCSDIDDVIEEIKKIGELRGSLEYDIDGAVVKVNSLEQRDILGDTGSVPRWAAAYKYPPETAETVLRDIFVQVGRTGVLTPNASFDSVRLAGTNVSKATLHNIDNIRAKDIRIGDTVIIRKAGDIIPEVVGAVLNKRPSDAVEYSMPEFCPSCGAPVCKADDEAATRCINSDCPAQLVRNLIHFVSKPAMNIISLGKRAIELLVNEGLIKSAADLYELRAEQLAELDRMGQKSASNIIAAIDNSKTAGAARLLNALGIRLIGEKAAILLTERFSGIEAISSATKEELCSIDEIGEESAQSLIDYFSLDSTKELIRRLKSFGVVTESEKKEKGNALLGMVVVVTGTLPTLSRSEAEKLIRDNGCTATSSVSKKTSFVLCGEQPGSKLEKANSLGIKVITEEELIEMINNK